MSNILLQYNHHDIAEILLKVALNTITLTPITVHMIINRIDRISNSINSSCSDN